ncbi:hypothetical protein MRX96_051652 [Rhipicephalus microplus]
MSKLASYLHRETPFCTELRRGASSQNAAHVVVNEGDSVTAGQRRVREAQPLMITGGRRCQAILFLRAYRRPFVMEALTATAPERGRGERRFTVARTLAG